MDPSRHVLRCKSFQSDLMPMSADPVIPMVRVGPATAIPDCARIGSDGHHFNARWRWGALGHHNFALNVRRGRGLGDHFLLDHTTWRRLRVSAADRRNRAKRQQASRDDFGFQESHFSPFNFARKALSDLSDRAFGESHASISLLRTAGGFRCGRPASVQHASVRSRRVPCASHSGQG